MKFEFDPMMKPTIRKEWLGLHPWRPKAFWWRVGCTVRVNRIRHMNREKIKAVCQAIDEAFPQYQFRKRDNDSGYRSSALPQYAR